MRLTFGILLSLMVGVAHANTDLTAAIENVRTTCGNISAELSDMKKMAGITTAGNGCWHGHRWCCTGHRIGQGGC